jgi:hypothetical protein
MGPTRLGVIGTAGLIVALVASGCTHGTTTSVAHSSSSGANAASAVFSSGATVTAGQLTTLFAHAGIATVADETTKTPQTAVTGATTTTLTADQVANMAAQTTSHGGITAGGLDDLLPIPNGPTLSTLVAIWASYGTDPSAKAAGSLLGRHDLHHVDSIVFPLAVLQLFLADALQQPGTQAGSPTSSPASSAASPDAAEAQLIAAAPAAVQAAAVQAAPVPVLTGICGVTNFINDVLSYIFDLLKLDPGQVGAYVNNQLGGGTLGAIGGGLAAFGALIENDIVNAGQAAIQGLINSITGPVLNILRLALGGLALVTMVASYLKPWHAAMSPSPTTNRFAVGSEADRTGSFTVTVDKNSLTDQWPDVLVQCAKDVGVALPTLSKEGLPVKWTVLGDEPGLVTPHAPGNGPFTTALDANLSSSLDYTTGREDEETAKGSPEFPEVTATAIAERTEVDDLRRFVLSMADPAKLGLPGIVAQVVSPMVAYYVNLAIDKLADLTGVDASTTIDVTHHIKPPPSTPPPSPSAFSSGNCATAVPAGTYTGPINATIVTHLHLGPSGSPGQDAGGGTSQATGSVTVVSDGQKVTGTFTAGGFGQAAVGLPDSVQVQSSSTGSMTGTISGPASSPVVDGTMHGVIDDGQTTDATFHAGLHLTQISCTSITGDLVAMFVEMEAPVAQYITFGGSGLWTATRK